MNEKMRSVQNELVMSKIQVLKALGFELRKDMKILDFGCGDGEIVQGLLELGYDAQGVDIMESSALDSSYYKQIEMNPYRIPYDDNTFDYVFSTSVFEHVQNTEEALKEIYRVLKPGGISTHCMPSRFRAKEPHIGVPFGGLCHSDAWLRMWAALGVRNEFQTGLPAKEVYERNKGYFRDCLNYMSYSKFKKKVVSVFGNINIYKWKHIKYMPGGAVKLGKKFPIPGYGYLLFAFREWNIYMKK
ncbi:class I SAM-dependent methyltransferase [Butyrivibrio sp. VCB2006]|uniref:class I SAM-dependent methyltransferase n=1 Tax=Butyrivibrio sp. VCB2006 TaxID=1280679 RepID=UPI000492B085|nr:class I SAM-dependent methyltransferase [Butyrivibrio sp. VCB2006]